MNELCPKSNKTKKKCVQSSLTLLYTAAACKSKESETDSKRVPRVSLSLNIVFAKKDTKHRIT